MAVTHTPGPYTVGPEHRESDGKSWVYYSRQRSIMSASGEDIAIVNTDYGGDENNHALFAAAPDLLAACEAVYGQLNYLRGLWGDEGITRRLCDQIEVAIVKANKGA